MKDVIHDVGKNEINLIVTQTDYLGKNTNRLTIIADLITSNFTDPNWNYQQNTNFF